MRIRSNRRPVAVLVLTLLAPVTCSDPITPADELPELLSAPGLVTTSWTRIDRGAFSFLLPPGFEDLGLQPIDSDAAVFAKAEDSNLQYDFGSYSAPIDIPPDATEVLRNVRTRIGGRDVTLLAFREGGAWVVGARWGDLGDGPLGPLALVMSGRTPSVEVRYEILAAIHSVRFE